MRKLKYLFMVIITLVMVTSCFEDDTTLDLNDDGLNVVTFERIASSLTAEANGEEYDFDVKVRISGPTVMDLTNDVTVTFTATDASTAVDGEHYRINNPTVTLTADNNYLGLLSITLITEGNSPPMDGTPEYEKYIAPELYLEISATGDDKVTGSGKIGEFTLNFTAPNPYKGVYDTEMRYYHPTAGGSHPSLGAAFDPDDPYGGIRNSQKELVAVTGRKCETGFAVWPETDLCWITVNPDNSVEFEVADTWTYEVKLGDPFNPELVSHFDPDTRQIFLYYHYEGSGGARIFHEVFTPTF
ncbi:MAG: hypothetical protein P1P82_06970 [Bacteroidales bacterium]|nr:hypothetical protein [Bacteroidales bacterium]